MFTNPTALFALGLLALPVVIHMLARLSGPRVVFASTRFLPRSVAPRFRLLKVHSWPLLVLRLMACGLLVLAISGPVLVTGDDDRRSALILLDASLSMNSEAIRESVVSQAREAVAALGEDDRVAVGRFDRNARPLCDFTGDRNLIERAIASYRPGYAAADFNAALVWADRQLRSQPSRRLLIIISDLQSTNVASLRQAGLGDTDLRVIRIERAEQDNASLDSAALRSFGGRIDLTTSLMMSESNRTEAKTISLGPASLADGAEATASGSGASLTARLVSEGVVAGRISTGVTDSFDADDNRFFVGSLPADGSVLIVQPLAPTRGHAWFVEKALQASLYNISDANPARVTDKLPGDTRSLRPYSAVICPARVIDKGNLNAVREYAREGGLLVLMLGPEEGDLPAELLDGASSEPLDQLQTTGLLPPVDSGQAPDVEPGLAASYASVRFRAARSVSAKEGDVVLRYTDGKPAAARVSVGKGSFVLLGFGLAEKDTSLARSPVFPGFIEWLIGGAGRSASVAQFIAGETPAAVLGGGARKLTRIYSADGGARFEEVALDLQTLDEPGVYSVERDAGEVVFAINTPAFESRLAQASEHELVDRIAPASASRPSSEELRAAAAEQAGGLWWLMAVAALALSFVELAYCSIGPKAEGD